MTLLIDTGLVAPAERADFWASASSEVYHPLQIRTDRGAHFSARMWGEWMDSIGVFRVAAGPNTMCRSQRDIDAGDPDCLHLHLLLRGRLQGVHNQRETVLAPWDLTTYDTSAPALFRATAPFDLLVLKLPKGSLEGDAKRISRLAAVTIKGGAGLPRQAGRFFGATAAGLAVGRVSSSDATRAEQVRQLVRRLYRELEHGPGSRPLSRPELFLQAQSYIDANLRDSTLNPEKVARACFISTRYLHRIFEEKGMTVSAWIRNARLERCRKDLLDPALAHEPIAAIAASWGLPSAQHFSRLFHATYGCCARDLRQAAEQTGSQR
jgi:AraC-like DNA-binding protein